ncbi:cell division protein FtsW [Allopseudospirillum japonicum]|uniref:Probable peptidoglycan glycosyltransferase FtsW n=1 Tax=Allopseudospirillum japonicum TaxID=64971 RepID=A0A1H6Q8T7_9GAMM|nr:putative lipid II flippase FtsW [Allopseudospirillum japonicum]SEI40199.1 cell division protein FtsW [Allopseudospirillum japonicum]
MPFVNRLLHKIQSKRAATQSPESSQAHFDQEEDELPSPSWLHRCAHYLHREITLDRGFDHGLVIAGLALLFLGWIMVSSASSELATSRYGSLFFFSVRHLIFLLIGLSAAAIVLLIPLRWWQANSFYLLLSALVLLLLVLIPGIGREVNGSVRWISLGPINVQTTEIAKVFVVVFFAGYLVRHLQAVRYQAKYALLRPLLVIGILCVLVLEQPDFGATVVIAGTSAGMLFMAGMRWFHVILVVLAGTGMAVLLVIVAPYRMQRLTSFIDPWAHQFDTGYQLTQALIAFGRGHWDGLGLGNSVQKLFYLPEAHTDFVFAVLAEELGLLGACITLALFILLVYRALNIGRRAEATGLLFAAYTSYGISLIFAIQVFINIGVNTGLLPTKGLTLPLMSYGGSSLVMSCVMLALLLRVDHETRQHTSP